MTYSTPDMRFEDTGEHRPPRRGEWFTGIVGPFLAEHDFFSPRPILRRVDDGPRSEDELERERLDAEAKENAGQRDERTTGLPAPDSGCESRAPLHRPKPNDLRPIGEAARSYRLPYGNDPED